MDTYTTQQKRDLGKSLFFGNYTDSEKRREGLKLILEAHEEGDPEANYLVARLIIDGVLRSTANDQNEYALTLMCSAANSGCIGARSYLNKYCQNRYDKDVSSRLEKINSQKGLVDFDGELIKIDRKGVLTPIDAVLETKNGKNVLTLSVNLKFLYGDYMPNEEKFEQAVCRGIFAWEGEYEVFGGQKLTLKINLSFEDRVFDNLVIIPVTTGVTSKLQSFGEASPSKNFKDRVDTFVTAKRSLASIGLKWSVNSRKLIFVQSPNGRFDDYDEIRHICKHEFGHALGLGDLYESQGDALSGVKKGSYTELDSFAISDKFYNLVMCDHHGPISNNDVEMVVLAFRENKLQLYQPSKLKDKISSALGKGN